MQSVLFYFDSGSSKKKQRIQCAAHASPLPSTCKWWDLFCVFSHLNESIVAMSVQIKFPNSQNYCIVPTMFHCINSSVGSYLTGACKPLLSCVFRAKCYSWAIAIQCWANDPTTGPTECKVHQHHHPHLHTQLNIQWDWNVSLMSHVVIVYHIVLSSSSYYI